MFSLRLFKADHPNGTLAEDLVRELARKPHPRYLECTPELFAQPTPYQPHLDGRVKFATILDGEWGVGGAEARAANTKQKAVDEGHHNVAYTTWPPVLSFQTDQRPVDVPHPHNLAVGRVKPSCVTGLATAQPPIGHERAQLIQQRLNYRKHFFREFERLVTARMLAQEEGDEGLLLREIMDLTLAVAMEDVSLERTTEPERALTPWEQWEPQATSTPHPSPASSTTLLSPMEACGALATSTVHHEYLRSSGKSETA
ncbi:uncharacterized protein C8Q71DRAFT_251097 [Rhodofomes roseus]|uniref:Uncharacterized protein n=1 Tax=Rhodofomes roseus TaxID=34475 RepID=A0ABQ8K723_9APHY|nr:uncharacterized protein C8Q71DRAFT_251097 [Rhodofomes roseus]KAH9833052.1 hypothetical protein C8Q71DRAFT_251097 [Rhodofomes roseus]